MSSSGTHRVGCGSAERDRGTRRDIQGLRATAVAAVVAYHLWPHSLRGGFVGVDVFFVVSGFLITRHLITAPPLRARDLAAFWARRIRRLLPAALLVIVAVLLATRLVAPVTQWRATGLQGIFSAVYAQNWHLAGRSVDYLAESSPPTALQHYWSLSVEEQFYLLWPLVLLCCALAARRLGRDLTSVVGLLVTPLAIGSLWFSFRYSQTHPAQAYFVTPTRIWELALGGLTAAATLRHGTPTGARMWRAAAVWVGYAAILFAAITYRGQAYPGLLALIPVLGAAAVIAADHDGRLTPNWPLRAAPVQYLGDISYSVYLWHWPLIVLWPYAVGHQLRTTDRCAILVVTLLLSAASKHLVEDRFRFARGQRTLVVPYRWAAAGTAVVVALATVQVDEVARRSSVQLHELQLAASSGDPCFAAGAMRTGARCAPAADDKVLPAPAVAAQDLSFSYHYDCVSKVPFDAFKTCEFGDRQAHVRVALVGNSHATHWLPALEQIALAKHFSITTFLSEKCFATDAEIAFPKGVPAETANCHRWGQQVQEATRSGGFNLVITSERTYMQPAGPHPEGDYRTWRSGYARYLANWLRGGPKLLVIRDVPSPHQTLDSVPDCVASHRHDLAACAGTRARWVLPDPLVDAAKAEPGHQVTIADLTNWFCTATTCPAVIGGALVYLDASHITATYSRSLAPALAPVVGKALRHS